MAKSKATQSTKPNPVKKTPNPIGPQQSTCNHASIQKSSFPRRQSRGPAGKHTCMSQIVPDTN